MVLAVNSQAVYGKTGMYTRKDALQVINLIHISCNPNHDQGLAAIMLEPLQGEGGIRPGVYIPM